MEVQLTLIDRHQVASKIFDILPKVKKKAYNTHCVDLPQFPRPELLRAMVLCCGTLGRLDYRKCS